MTDASPNTDTKTFTFRITDKMFADLEVVATKEDRSKAAVVRLILERELENRLDGSTN